MPEICIACQAKCGQSQFHRVGNLLIQIQNNQCGERIFPHTHDTHELHFEVALDSFFSVNTIIPPGQQVRVKICVKYADGKIKIKSTQVGATSACILQNMNMAGGISSVSIWLNDCLVMVKPLQKNPLYFV